MVADSNRIMHEALEKIRLHGSVFWNDRWGRPSHIANDALNESNGKLPDVDIDAALAVLERHEMTIAGDSQDLYDIAPEDVLKVMAEAIAAATGCEIELADATEGRAR